MPVFSVKLSDGRTVRLEADQDPTEDEVLAAVGEADIGSQFLYSPGEIKSLRPPRPEIPPTTVPAGFVEEATDRLGDFFGGVGQFASSTLKTIGAGMSQPNALAENVPMIEAPAPAIPEQHPLYRAGQNLETRLNQAFPQPEEFSFPRAVVRGAGQIVPMLAGGAAAKALGAGAGGAATVGAGMGVAMEFDDAFERARKRGDSADAAFAKSLGYATLAGLIENKLGAGRILRQMFPNAVDGVKKLTAMGVSKKILGNFVAGGVEEGAQRFAQNWIVEGKPSTEGVLQEAAVGSVVEGVAGLPGAAVTPPAAPTAEPLLNKPPGETTAQEVMSLSDAEARKFFEGNQARGNATQHDSVLAGAKLGPEAVQELTQMRDAAQEAAMEAIQNGDVDGSFSGQGRVVWLNGAIEGANKAGPNYDAVNPPKVEQATPPEQQPEGGTSSGQEVQMQGQEEVLGENVAGAIATAPPLTPAATTPATLQPKAQRQIIADLAKGLNIPIRFGRLTTSSKFAGYFKPRANLIGSRKAIDIPTVSHEVGHKLDSVFKLSADKTIASELDVLGDPATPGSGSSWTKSKTKAYKMGEGVAEFVRYWMTDPPKALSMAPNTHRLWEAALDSNKDFGDVMRQAREDIQTWRNSEPQARLRSQIVSGNPNKTKYTGSQLIRDLVDDLHILRLATEHGAKTSPLDPSKNAYLLARNLRGSYGMADTFVRHGVTDFDTKKVQLGTSLSDALKPVAGRLNDFRDWIVAKRAQELIAQGRETGLVKSDVDAVAAKFDGDAAFQKAFSDVKAWNDALLQYAVDAGFVTPESADAMRKMNQDYVPFHRVFEVGAGEAPSQQSTGTGMGLNVGKPGSMKRLRGSVRSIADPLETMVQNAYTLITAAEKSAINRAVAEMADLPDMGRWVERVAAPNEAVKVTADKIRKELEAAGADMTAVPDDLIVTFFRQGSTAPFGENTIRVIRNGKQEFYRLNRDLHDTFKALDLEDTGTLIKILAAPAQLLRSGVVLEPSFNIANVIRDTFSSAVIGKYGAFPFQSTLKGVTAMLSNPQAIAEWAAAGGRNSVESVYFDRDKLKKFLAERISKDLSPAERALIVAKSPLTALRYMTSIFEEATRVGEYQIAFKKLTESGMPEGEARRLAAYESRDRQDFAKGGAKTKIVRHLAAFWNAALQANVKLLQSFKERPVRTTLQGLAFITIPKLLEQALNWDDDDYWDRPQWERDLFFLIPIGKDETGHTRFLRLPTPFEVGIIFGTFPGRIMEWMKTKRPDAMEGFPQLMLKNSIPNPIPQSGQMIFEDFLSGKQGWDVYRGRTIVPDALKDLPPDLQYNEQTSRAAKEIGGRLGFSPMKVDHIIESTTGGLGKLATGRSDPFGRFVTRPLRVSNQPTEDFYIRLEEMRMQAARTKLTGEGEIPDDLKAYERTAKTLSELRKELRDTTSEKEKAGLQKEMFELISDTVKP